MTSTDPLRLQEQRKRAHLALAEKFYRAHPQGHADFQQVRLLHPELPEVSLAEIDLSRSLFKKEIAAPFYINAMTGGTAAAQPINQKLAHLAAHFELPLAVGSMSILQRAPELAASFTVVRAEDPTGVVFANLGANHSPAVAEQMVDLLAADALQIHLNAAQEFAMPEGDDDFHWRENFQSLQARLGAQLPLIAKEVGFGMSPAALTTFAEWHLAGVDLSGASSTNFIAIENERRDQPLLSDLSDFGLSTVESLLGRWQVYQKLTRFSPLTFASGGIRTPWEAIKAFALGADLVGMSGYFLHLALHQDEMAMIKEFERWLAEFRGLLALMGCHNVGELRQVPLILGPELASFAQQLGLDPCELNRLRSQD
ncbi:type 2 isopentenyl-diphosphate Delta-isomerase [Lapidilactobacillus luobeiensis]|uniref:type 2 isopentenyl-diphosphate Delta-isomerase n=1 Tax=Lapidilactobacillus luobeiensis TaxID=2950371 RepID=UPI0021C3A800|nr:type 2 isopentenyl-diphosphate Delta-isomerase [Lapidilactobacillus luobeiensis]